MNEKEKIQYMYKKFREDNNKDTKRCLEFLKWLHEDKKQLYYLSDMVGLSYIEAGYIDNLLQGHIEE